MPGSTKKATKKFQKNHLSDTITKRKEFAKIKQRHQVKAKKKARNAADKAESLENAGRPHTATKELNGAAHSTSSKRARDEDFRPGFDLPEQKQTQKSTARTKDVSQSTGKRKREERDNPSEETSSFEGNLDMNSDGTGSDQEDDLEGHKGDLDALHKNDPEFYEYLKENDAELLDFDEDVDLGEIDRLSEDEAPPKKHNNSKTLKEGDDSRSNGEESSITLSMIEKWENAMSEQSSLRAMREVVLAFRAAAHINSEDGKQYKYSIPNSQVYHRLLVITLEHVPKVLNHHLPAKEASSGKVRIATDSKKYRTLTPLLKSHSASILYLLENLSDASTIKLTLSSLLTLLPYLLSFKKILKSFVKTSVNIWSDTSSDEAARITAFLLIRRLTVISDASLREAVLKTTYQGLVKGSRITNIHTLAGINLMKNSAAELWGLDPNIGYSTGFTFIRQLAVNLRTCITQPTKDSYTTIYNWQYAHSLDFWSRVLSTHCSPLTNVSLKTPAASPLHPLIYPLVQITLGALRLIPTPAYFPLRFHLIRSLLRISRTTNTYIPLAPALLEVLSSPDLSKPPKPSTLSPLDFSVILRAPKAYLRTRAYQDGLGQQVQELLAEFFGCWAKHIAFPELIIPPSVVLKRWLHSASSTPSRGNKKALAKADREGKGNKNAKVNSLMSLLLQKLSANAQYVEHHRSQVSFGPSNREGVDGFLRDVPIEDTPLGAFVEGMRKQKEEKEKLLEQGKREEEGRKKREDDRKSKRDEVGGETETMNDDEAERLDENDDSDE